MCLTKSKFNCSKKKYYFHEQDWLNFFCNFYYPPPPQKKKKTFTCLSDKLRTEFFCPIEKSTSPAQVIRHYFLCMLHRLICKYSKIKTEKVTKEILSYLWNNMSFTSTFRLNCLANLSASSNLCLWSNLDNLKKRQICHD